MNQKPEQNEDEEILDFTKPDYQFTPGAYHDWRQQGYYLVCKSCEIQHATWIGPDKLLVGYNDKLQPIIKLRKLTSNHKHD